MKSALQQPTQHPSSTSERIGDDAWGNVKRQLKAKLGDAAFKSWLEPLKYAEIKNDIVHFTLPTKFMRQWVTNHYGDEILKLWHTELPTLAGISIDVAPSIKLANVDQKAANQEVSTSPTHVAVPAKSESPKNSILSAPLDPRLTFDNFVVGKPNELAFAAARRVAESPVAPFNPLFLYGGVGLGKTHLMHAIAWHIRSTSPERTVAYLSAEKFMYQFIRAIRYKDTVSFKDQFRNVDVLMIDDVQFIGGKDSTQEEFFHTFNALVDQNRQVIISADKSPSDLEGLEERLRSRLGWGLVADIHPTTYELRLGIIEAKADKLKIDIPKKVCEFLAYKITSNIRELEGALNRIAAHATLVGRSISVETVQELLKDLLRANDKRLSIEDIQKQVAEHYSIRTAEILSAGRARAIARPRQIAMYLTKKLTTLSLPEIGRKFGGRDHTTIMHGVKTIEKLIETDQEVAENVELLQKILQS